MAKQLRLDVAQLTDVGRKREHNEDNMAYVIPKDPQVMAKKGALFIVADGMGGHAAGEVASEIAVDTVSNVFYQDDSDDVAASLLHAIKRANASIHQRAAENMLRSGMGTTCVAAVLRGNIAYIANVGDSRAYLVRGGQVRQVSQDHSWVAEQVRAGLLTEDQARTHAQRNVITRNLGTLAEVEVDVFVENLEEGDSFVLCTDGLSGLVNDDEIRRIVHDFVPQESVYHLVERANENGGPDNITAIVVRVAEVGAEVNGVRPPARVGAGSGREAAEASIVSMPTSPMAFASPSSQRSDGLTSSASTKYAAGSPSSSESTLSTTLPLSTKKRRGRLFFPTLILVLLIVAGAVGSGVYYFLNNRPANVDTSLANAQALIVEANASSSNDPASSLRDLSQAQKMLKDLSNQPLTQAQRQRTTSLLQQDITSSTGTAIKNYNRLFLINSLPCTNTQSTTLNAGTSNATPLNVITTSDDKGNTALYTLAQDSTLYQITNNTTLASQIRGTAPIIAASTNNTDKHVYLLMSQATNGQNPANYSIASLAVGQTKPDKSNPITATNLKNGLVPRLITAWNNDIYVVLTSANGGNSATVLTYQGNKLGTAPTQTTLSVNANIIGVTAYPNHQLFLLLSDGSIQSAQTGTTTSGSVTTSNVLIQNPLHAPLGISSKDFSGVNDTVPTVTTSSTQKGPLPLAIKNPQAIASGIVKGTPHLFIADGTNHSVLDLTMNGVVTNTGGSVANTPTKTSANGVTLQLSQQYTSPQLLSQVKGVAVDPKGTVIYVLSQGNTTKGASLISSSIGPQNACS